MKVSIQGQPGSLHDVAARHYFGSDYKPLPRPYMRQVLGDVEEGKAPYGLIAIENSLYGSMNPVYDELLKHPNLWICGEIYVKMSLCLIGLKNTRLEKLREIYTHPLALTYAEDFLDEEIPYAARIATSEKVGSVAAVKQWNDPTKAAIAREEAAQLYGLEVLCRDIETYHNSYTRFVIVNQSKKVADEADKTSVVFLTLGQPAGQKDGPGMLNKTLTCFADRDINLSKTASRLVKNAEWHNIFYIDFDESLSSPIANEALACIEKIGAEASVLGSYKHGRYVD